MLGGKILPPIFCKKSAKNPRISLKTSKKQQKPRSFPWFFILVKLVNANFSAFFFT